MEDSSNFVTFSKNASWIYAVNCINAIKLSEISSHFIEIFQNHILLTEFLKPKISIDFILADINKHVEYYSKYWQSKILYFNIVNPWYQILALFDSCWA